MPEVGEVWWLYVPGVVIVLGGLATFRWLIALQKRVSDHAERISWMEARINGKHRGE